MWSSAAFAVAQAIDDPVGRTPASDVTSLPAGDSRRCAMAASVSHHVPNHVHLEGAPEDLVRERVEVAVGHDGRSVGAVDEDISAVASPIPLDDPVTIATG